MRDMHKLLILLFGDEDIIVGGSSKHNSYDIKGYTLYDYYNIKQDTWTIVGDYPIVSGHMNACRMLIKELNLKIREELL